MVLSQVFQRWFLIPPFFFKELKHIVPNLSHAQVLLCMDMCISMFIDMCMGMCVGICIGMCIGMHMNICIDFALLHLHYFIVYLRNSALVDVLDIIQDLFRSVVGVINEFFIHVVRRHFLM